MFEEHILAWSWMTKLLQDTNTIAPAEKLVVFVDIVAFMRYESLFQAQE